MLELFFKLKTTLKAKGYTSEKSNFCRPSKKNPELLQGFPELIKLLPFIRLFLPFSSELHGVSLVHQPQKFRRQQLLQIYYELDAA